MIRRLLAAGLVLSGGLGAPAMASNVDSEIAGAYAQYSLPIPTSSFLVVCHGFGCKFRTPLALSAADQARFRALLSGAGSAAAERKAIAAAVGWFDRRVGPVAGTKGHVARAGMKYMNDRGQFDCIDSSRNTMAVLLVLQDMKLLQFHRVVAPVARGYVIDFRPPHVTAVIQDRRSGQKWAIDSWTRGYGKPAEVLPLERWADSD